MERASVRYYSVEPKRKPRRASGTPRIAVVGAGIAGVTSAYRIRERFPDINVDVLAAEFPPRTTSDAVAGLWTPYLCSDDPTRVKQWAKATYEHWEEVHRTADAPLMGISKLGGTYLHTTYEVEPFWKSIVEGYRRLQKTDVKCYGAQYCCGDAYTAFTSEAKLLSPFLLTRIVDNGGALIQRKLDKLDELRDDYDVIVNCTGLAAYSVVPDASIRPIRGQVMRVKAPWVKTFLMDDDNYIIPNIDSVLLGGTHQEGDWNTQVDRNDSDHIQNGCRRLMPCLQKAPILTEWVGLRPSRSTVRLEAETLTGGKSTHVIHNYGHGGSGLTLCWGCAGDVVELLHDHFRSRASYAAKL